MGDEVWLPVVGLEDAYEVSSLGRVRSTDREVRAVNGKTWKILGRVLKTRINRGGYDHVNLAFNGVVRTRPVHRLVAEAHIPNPDDKPLVLHGGNGQRDNGITNLSWGDHSQNMYDRRRDGTNPDVNKTHCPQGHEYTQENTRMDDGSRKCRECIRVRSRAYYWRKKGARDNGSD